MKSRLFLLALCISSLFSAVAIAQSTNAALSGTVTDDSAAVLSGTTVTAQNVKTGVVTTTATNDAGVFVFPSLQPGTYTVTAEKQGFKKYVYNDVVLELSARITLNFSLQLGTINEVTEVVASQDTQLSIGTTSVGGVINGLRVQELPLPGRDALGLVLTQAGLVGDNFSGARIGTLNVALDGVNVTASM